MDGENHEFRIEDSPAAIALSDGSSGTIAAHCLVVGVDEQRMKMSTRRTESSWS